MSAVHLADRVWELGATLFPIKHDLPAVLSGRHLTAHCAIGARGILSRRNADSLPRCLRAWFGHQDKAIQKPASVHTHGRATCSPYGCSATLAQLVFTTWATVQVPLARHVSALSLNVCPPDAEEGSQ
jgi:hypothetical protein